MTRSTWIAFLLLLVLGGIVPGVVAQTGLMVRGAVTDETGGLIVGAAVTLTDERGTKTTARTNQEGRYQVVTQSRGRVTLTVQAAGFAPSSRTWLPTRRTSSACTRSGWRRPLRRTSAAPCRCHSRASDRSRPTRCRS